MLVATAFLWSNPTQTVTQTWPRNLSFAILCVHPQGAKIIGHQIGDTLWSQTFFVLFCPVMIVGPSEFTPNKKHPEKKVDNQKPPKHLNEQFDWCWILIGASILLTNSPRDEYVPSSGRICEKWREDIHSDMIHLMLQIITCEHNWPSWEEWIDPGIFWSWKWWKAQ